jgi:hypothetical protein
VFVKQRTSMAFDRFATEWVMWDEKPEASDQKQQESEESPPPRRAPVSSVDGIGCPVFRAVPRNIGKES